MALVVVVAALLVHLPTLSGGFFWDTPRLRDGVSLFVPFSDLMGYRPLFWISMDLDKMLWGMWAPGYHVINLLLHAANSALLMFLARRVGLGPVAAFVAAGLFAVHPINVEAVGWVFGRAWLLGALFSMTAFLLYLRFVVDRMPPAAVSSALFFLLAILSVPGAVVLFLLVVLHAWYAGLERKNLLLLIALYVLAVVAHQFFFRGQGELMLAQGMLPGMGVYDALSVVGFYFAKLVLPVGIVPLPHLSVGVIYAMTGLVPVFALYPLYSEGYKAEAAALCAMVVLLLPGLLEALGEGRFPVGARYAYLPGAAFCVLVAMLFERLWLIERVGRGYVLKVFMSALFVVYAVIAFSGALGWSDPDGLWQDVAARHGNKAMVHINRGASLIEGGKPAAGAKAMSSALATDDVSEDHFPLIMRLYELTGGSGQSMMFEAMAEARGQALAEYGMGFIYYKRYIGKRSEVALLRKAVQYFEAALAKEDYLYQAHYYLGLSLLEARQYQKAEQAFLRARETDMDGRYKTHTDDMLAFINTTRGPRAPFIKHEGAMTVLKKGSMTPPGGLK